MKKILILLILLCFTCCSCKKKQPEKTYHYDFLTEEEILKDINDVWVAFNIDSITTEIIYNDTSVYFSLSDIPYYIDLETNTTYKVDTKNNVLLYNQEEKLEKDSVVNIVRTLFTSYLKINDSSYLKKDGGQIVGLDCDKYYYENTVSNISIYEEYYISKEYNICLKDYHKTINKSKITETFKEVTKLSFDKQEIAAKLTEFKNYIIKNEQVQYGSWPKTALGKLIPELNSGNFIVAVDDVVSCLIMIENITEKAVKDYTLILNNYGFNNSKEEKNDAGQYIFKAYNLENVYLELKYDNGQLSIYLKQSTSEEIADEFNN